MHACERSAGPYASRLGGRLRRRREESVISRHPGIAADRRLLAGLVILALLIAVLGAIVVLASLRSDRQSAERERQALLASLRAHATVMERALATTDRERDTLDDLARGATDRVHDRYGRRLSDGFGFEFVYIVDADGKVLYASEHGKLGEQGNLSWIRPAIERALAEGRTEPQSGIVSGDAGAGLMVARPFTERSPALGAAQPLLAVTVDVIDPSFLQQVGEPANVQGVKVVSKSTSHPGGRAVFVPNLASGAEAELVWTGTEPGRSLLHDLLPVVTGFAVLLAGIFLALMVRARRMAHALVRSEARVRELAHQDFLTGLANRGYFLEELEAALATGPGGKGIALLFIDLDGFKEINDGAGHGAGDAILRAVADTLREAVGSSGTIGRFGGDEFVVFARLDTAEALDLLVARIFQLLEAPVPVEGEAVRVSASIGVARAPEDATTASELMRLADIALYRAKAEGRGTCCLFEARFEREQAQRRQLVSELTAAIERSELTLTFQPQLNLETERIVGFEVLVRWDHPTRGRLLPSEFVPAAEESPLIATLDLHILRRACIEARPLGNRRLAVNMSPVTLRTSGISRRIIDTLRETTFDPAQLEVEITESVVLHATPEVQQSFEELRAAGISLALDDFGTGYASVVHVRRFPITKIKIDKTFIFKLGEDPDAAAIVEYKVRVGRSLGLAVTAEGVETPEQLRFLRSIGLPEAQGYLFAPPLPLAAAIAMLEREAEADGRKASATKVETSSLRPGSA